ncbi:hypothetical protein INR49_006729, partial [Caranx melampygus]
MLVRRSLFLTWGLLATTIQSQNWRPCTDLLPLDLLSRALPRPGQAPPTQVQMVQSRGSRGLRLAGATTTAMSFPASQIFTNCDHFPAEFSLVATVKIPRLRQKRNEYIFSVLEDRTDSLLLGLRVSENRLHFLTMSPGPSGRSRLSFKDVSLDDNRWHTVVLAITGPYATLTIDCGLPLEFESGSGVKLRPVKGASALQAQTCAVTGFLSPSKQAQSFPSTLSTRGSVFFIGSRRRWRGRFSGLLRQLVLLPGSDATPRLCPSSEPRLAELSVPQVLKSTPLQPEHGGPLYPYEAEVRVTVGNPPPCWRLALGHMWLDPERRSLFMCDGLRWKKLLQSEQRLDYVENYQDLYTSSETFDVELFSIPSEGLFMAAANRDSVSGSGIFKWRNGSFQLYQYINTQEARAWKHFTINDQIFLVVANSREAEPELSVIYRWSPQWQRFLRCQTLETHGALDWEAFHIHNHSFLVVANHRQARDSNHNIQSVIYRWNQDTQMFEVNQTLSTSGAYDWEFFSVGPFHFLVVANTFDGQTTSINSTVYVWVDGRFQTFQNISVSVALTGDQTVGATDWEAFEIDGRFFLVVANSQRVPERGPNPYSINSTVYELSALTHTFMRFQDILTHSVVVVQCGGLGVLHSRRSKVPGVANSYDGNSYSLNSVSTGQYIPSTSVHLLWQGYEGFVPVHSLPTFGCRDWEHFSTDEGSFLVYSSATSRLSKVLKAFSVYEVYIGQQMRQVLQEVDSCLISRCDQSSPVVMEPELLIGWQQERVELKQEVSRLQEELAESRAEREELESVGLVETNALLREQLSQSEQTNQELREDLQKLTADWTRAVEEVETRESDWLREKESHSGHVGQQQARLLSVWRCVVALRRQCHTVRTAADRDLWQLRAEFSRLSSSLLSSCDSVSSSLRLSAPHIKLPSPSFSSSVPPPVLLSDLPPPSSSPPPLSSTLVLPPADSSSTEAPPVSASTLGTSLAELEQKEEEQLLHEVEVSQLKERIVELSRSLQVEQREREEREKEVERHRESVRRLQSVSEAVIRLSRALRGPAPPPSVSWDTVFSLDLSSLLSVLSQAESALLRRQEELQGAELSVRRLGEEKTAVEQRLKHLEDDQQQLHTHTQHTQHELTHTLELLHREQEVSSSLRLQLEEVQRREEEVLTVVCFRVEAELLENVQQTERETRQQLEVQTLKVETRHCCLSHCWVLNQGALEKEQLDRCRAEEEAAEVRDALQQSRECVLRLSSSECVLKREVDEGRDALDKMAALNSALASDKRELNKQLLQALRSEVSALRLDCTRLRAQREEEAEVIHQLRDREEEKERRMEEEERRMEEMERRMEEEERRMEEKERRMEDKERELISLMEEREKDGRQLEELASQHTSVCGELKEVQEQLSRAEEEVRRRERQQEEQQRESRRLQEEREALHTHREQLQEELQELRSLSVSLHSSSLSSSISVSGRGRQMSTEHT